MKESANETKDLGKLLLEGPTEPEAERETANMKNEAGTQVVFSVTPEELEALKKAANDSGLNVSQYCRALIFKRKIKNPKKVVLDEFTETK